MSVCSTLILKYMFYSYIPTPWNIYIWSPCKCSGFNSAAIVCWPHCLSGCLAGFGDKVTKVLGLITCMHDVQSSSTAVVYPDLELRGRRGWVYLPCVLFFLLSFLLFLPKIRGASPGPSPRSTTALVVCRALGRVVWKLVNVNPGLKVKRRSNFPSIKLLSTAYVFCGLRLFMLKTEGQKI